MNIDLDAIRALQKDRDALCEDVASQAQTVQLRGVKAQSRLERMNRAKVNPITLSRLEREVQSFPLQVDQFKRLFTTLRCKTE